MVHFSCALAGGWRCARLEHAADQRASLAFECSSALATKAMRLWGLWTTRDYPFFSVASWEFRTFNWKIWVIYIVIISYNHLHMGDIFLLLQSLCTMKSSWSEVHLSHELYHPIISIHSRPVSHIRFVSK